MVKQTAMLSVNKSLSILFFLLFTFFLEAEARTVISLLQSKDATRLYKVEVLNIHLPHFKRGDNNNSRRLKNVLPATIK